MNLIDLLYAEEPKKEETKKPLTLALKTHYEKNKAAIIGTIAIGIFAALYGLIFRRIFCIRNKKR